MPSAYARAPAALSSIFSPKLFGAGEEKIRLDEVGARGGGFALAEGSETWVEVDPEGVDETSVVVNDSIHDFPPSIEAAEEMRRRLRLRGAIRIRHRIKVPIGAGFGTSASSAMGVILALSNLLGDGMTMREAARITHEVELRCRTGLNSEVGLLAGGLILVLREGAPPKSIIDVIPLPPKVRLVAVVAGPLKTPEMLSDLDRLEEVERIGDKHLFAILRRPTPENFLTEARKFAYEAGFVAEEVEEIFETMKKLPLIGYAQNMLGKAAHALVLEENIRLVEKELRETFPDWETIISEIGYGVKVSFNSKIY